jgi:hypothetical protein
VAVVAIGWIGTVIVGPRPQRRPTNDIDRDSYLPRLTDRRRKHVLVRSHRLATVGRGFNDEFTVLVVGTGELMAGGALVPAPREAHLVQPAVVVGGEYLATLADELTRDSPCRDYPPLPQRTHVSLIRGYLVEA